MGPNIYLNFLIIITYLYLGSIILLTVKKKQYILVNRGENMFVGIGFAQDKSESQLVKESFSLAALNLNTEKIDLAIVLTSSGFSFPSLIKTIKYFLQDTPVLGCSGTAVFFENIIIKHGLVIILINFSSEIYFNYACVKEVSSKGGLIAGKELSEKLLYGFHNIRRDGTLVFSDGLIVDNSGLLLGIQENLGKSFPVIGGCASDNLVYKKTNVFYNSEILNNAASALILGGRAKIGLGVRHGWRPIGKPHIISESNLNVINKIDGIPAINIYEDYFGIERANLKKELKNISILYPIGILLPGESEYLLRNLISVLEDGSLVFQGNVPLGSTIRLMISNKESCLDAAKQAAEEAKMVFLKDQPKFGLVFDSVSRYILLGRQAKEELNILKRCLGEDLPFAGVYTYGEFAPLSAVNYQGVSRMHNQTASILLIGEQTK